MKEINMKDAGLELLESADTVYVTTIDEDGYPQTRCMFNLRNKRKFPKLIDVFKNHNEDFMVLFTTNTSSEKIAQIKRNSAVCLYYCKPDKFQGIMLSGDMEIANDPKIREALWHEGWERYYPKGPHDPDHTVLRMYPKKAKGWYESRTFAFRLKETK
ncbi:MAG: pyridoxamine 5'-phosphate oxidase family protein [candidate division WOR-3 bacterium]|nr:MAG: pyridoxamine 5'-phosphate oxidase family protein [candidate division WOR-3 bacterium]